MALHGLVLAGGKSSRMGQDKSLLAYHGVDQRAYCHGLLSRFCSKVFLSCREEQIENTESRQGVIVDLHSGMGPAGGLLSAHQSDSGAAWLVLPCDMPLVTPEALALLVRARDPAKAATIFFNRETGFSEPLIGIWEPRALTWLHQQVERGDSSPHNALRSLECVRVPASARLLLNVNRPLRFSGLEPSPIPRNGLRGTKKTL